MKECVLCAINCVVLLLGIKNECAGRVDRCPQCLECAQRLQVRLRSWLVEGPARNMVGKMAPLKPKTLEPSEPPRPPNPQNSKREGINSDGVKDYASVRHGSDDVGLARLFQSCPAEETDNQRHGEPGGLQVWRRHRRRRRWGCLVQLLTQIAERHLELTKWAYLHLSPELRIQQMPWTM